MNIKMIKNKLEEDKHHIKTSFYVKEIGIFGSFIKGIQTSKSDIDILVDFEEGHKDFFNYMRLKYYLENILKRKVDLIMKKAIKPQLKKHILKEVEYV
jgi:uncharacterized protein